MGYMRLLTPQLYNEKKSRLLLFVGVTSNVSVISLLELCSPVIRQQRLITALGAMSQKTTLKVKVLHWLPDPSSVGIHVLAFTAMASGQNISTSFNFKDLVMNCIFCLVKHFYRMTVIFK